MGFINRLLGGEYNEKELKKLWPLVAEVNKLADETAAMSDEELAALSTEFRERLAAGETVDDILPEAFAAVREASTRRIGLRHFDVQILGGVVLHQGKISEMKTGEGKTLVATLPLYLNALAGEGAHLVTVNDYLAKRDAQWMGPIYHSLGLTIGVLQHDTAYVYDPTANLENASLRYLRPGHAPGCLRRGHHLRHEQRVRLRLPARQHGSGLDAGRAAPRHRRTPTRSSTRWTASSSTRRGRR